MADTVGAMFDRIVVVDWSANGAPKRGADSIWVCRLEVATGEVDVVNHRTRHAARDALSALTERSGRTLVGFDFPLGYPVGFAAAVGLPGVPWETTWAHLAEHVHDDHRNRNDRWVVATEWNRALGTPHFWGAPPSRTGPHMPSHKPSVDGLRLAQCRVAEARLRAGGLRPFTVWQLLGAGSVGSQVLTGVPVVEHFRRDPSLRDRIRVWPFETGLVDRPAHDVDDAIVVAEVWPSAIAFDHIDHPVKDARQVIALAAHFAALDEDGGLGALFRPQMTDSERDGVLTEEGWVLGVR
jgi:precorrin-8X/cobalt-precorrin-8 methylmutase